MTNSLRFIEAQAHLHHQYFLGLQLMVSLEEGREVVGEWMFRLFRRLHDTKFLSSFQKLGLEGLPHAVACAKYHVLSNGVGGVHVEYMEETDKKAWVRFRYPRWLYDGPAICGVPVEASRGFLRGWYAQNGVTLQNPRLGFVCVSEDLTAQFGFCGYFIEYEHDLTPTERLRFAPNELPPPFNPLLQPSPPDEVWNEERLKKAGRNYALEYCRNGICELAGIIGRKRTLEIGKKSARLTGLQQFQHMADIVGCHDGNVAEASRFLAAMFEGMGDEVALAIDADEAMATLRHTGLRAVRGIAGDHRAMILACWNELWFGAVSSHRAFIDVRVEKHEHAQIWCLSLSQKPAT